MKIEPADEINLCDELVWNWSEENWFWWILNDASGQRLFGFAFQDDTFSLGESHTTFLVVGLDAGQEFVTALRGLDVFNADVDALGENLSSVTLIDDNSQCVLSDVIDASSLSVVGLEGHTFVNGTIALEMTESLLNKGPIPMTGFNSP